MNVVVWNFDGYDIASPGNGDAFNYFAIRESERIQLEEKLVTTGHFTFNPGARFSQIGNGKKTSSGYYNLNLDPGYELQYVAVSGEYLLFRLVINGVLQIPNNRDLFGKINRDYDDIYFAYRLVYPGTLFWLSPGGAGRIIEL